MNLSYGGTAFYLSSASSIIVLLDVYTRVHDGSGEQGVT